MQMNTCIKLIVLWFIFVLNDGFKFGGSSKKKEWWWGRQISFVLSLHRTVVRIIKPPLCNEPCVGLFITLCVRNKTKHETESVKTSIDTPVQNEMWIVWPPHYVAVLCKQLNIHSDMAYLHSLISDIRSVLRTLHHYSEEIEQMPAGDIRYRLKFNYTWIIY